MDSRKYYERQKQRRHTGCERYCTDFDMANGALLGYTDVTAIYFTRSPVADSTWWVPAVSCDVCPNEYCNSHLGVVPALCVK